MPEIRALQAGPGATSAVRPMTPAALCIEDPSSCRELTGVSVRERPGLRSQQLCDRDQTYADTETVPADVLHGAPAPWNSVDYRRAGGRNEARKMRAAAGRGSGFHLTLYLRLPIRPDRPPGRPTGRSR